MPSCARCGATAASWPAPDVRFETKHGPAEFAVGDRVQFTDTDKRRASTTAMSAPSPASTRATGVITRAAGRGRGGGPRGGVVGVGVRRGSGTAMPGRSTRARARPWTTPTSTTPQHWRAAASYVALTRQRESAQVFVARETARDAGAARPADGARRGARRPPSRGPRATSWRRRCGGRRGSVTRRRTWTASQRRTQRHGRRGSRARRTWLGVAEGPRWGAPDSLRAKVRAAQERQQQTAAAHSPSVFDPLIPAFVSRDGRDSLGRGLDPASVAVVVAKDYVVQQEREALAQYLRGAYRDPYAAKAQLDELVKSQGFTSTAMRIRSDPAQLGPLRGKTGFFAGAQAKADRATAERVAGAIAPALDRIARVESRAAETYRTAVADQRRADAVAIPSLSTRANEAVSALAAAPDNKTRAALWRGIAADQGFGGVGEELGRFGEAVRQRFGDDVVRAMRRGQGESIEVASIGPEHRAALNLVSRTVHVLGEAKLAREHEVRAERLAQRQTLGHRRGLGR